MPEHLPLTPSEAARAQLVMIVGALGMASPQEIGAALEITAARTLQLLGIARGYGLAYVVIVDGVPVWRLTARGRDWFRALTLEAA